MKNSDKNSKQGPGRPRYIPALPRKTRFTITDVMVHNGVDMETGKGPKCSKLTVINWKNWDKSKGKNSEMVQLKGTSTKSNSEIGLGRKQFVFCKRADFSAQQAEIDLANETKKVKVVKVKTVKVKATKVKVIKPAKTVKVKAIKVKTVSPVTVNIGNGKTYDEVKAALLAPSAPVVIVPVVDIAPVEAAPVIETPVAAPLAEVAAPVAA